MVQAAHSIPACCNCVLMTSYSCSRHRAAPDRHRRGARRYHSPDLTRALAPSLDPSGADSTAEDNPRNAIGRHDLDSIGSPQGDPVTSLHASDSKPSCGTCCACACALLAWSMPHERLTKRLHAWHCPSAPRTPLDPLQTVGAVQVGAAVGAEVVTGLYVDHRVSTHGALFFPACGHPPYVGIRFILLILAGTVPASYYLFWQARCPRQRPSGPCAHVAARVLRYMLLTRQKRHLNALTGQSRWILATHTHTVARAVCCTTPNRRHRMPAPRHPPRHV